MMAYEGSESARDNFGKFINQFQPETKTLSRKLERILDKLYIVCLYHLMKHAYYIYNIYIYIYINFKINQKRIYGHECDMKTGDEKCVNQT